MNKLPAAVHHEILHTQVLLSNGAAPVVLLATLSITQQYNNENDYWGFCICLAGDMEYKRGVHIRIIVTGVADDRHTLVVLCSST